MADRFMHWWISLLPETDEVHSILAIDEIQK